MSSVCIVILNWNQPEMTLRCVRNVLALDFPAGFATLVIDNGSAPANVAALEAGLATECMLLKNGQNIGFAGGMNLGIDFARRKNFDYVWLLNNDAFPDADCLARLVRAADADRTLAALTPRLVHEDDSAQPLGSRVDWETAGLYPLPPGPLPKPTPAGWYITGAALFLRTAALDDQGFDSRFFAYWEDFDLCTRLIRQGGTLSIEESARCVHLLGASSGVTSPLVTYLMVRNAWLFVRKHQPKRSWPRLWLRQAALQFLHAGGLDEQGHRAQALAVLAGLWAGLQGAFGQPRRMTVPDIAGERLLRHFSGVARTMWSLANFLAPATLRRAALGYPKDPVSG